MAIGTSRPRLFMMKDDYDGPGGIHLSLQTGAGLKN
jgi:hypothetical protein